jgi:hypothetical protein
LLKFVLQSTYFKKFVTDAFGLPTAVAILNEGDKNFFQWNSAVIYHCILISLAVGTLGQCYKTFYHGNLLPLRGFAIILCYKTLIKQNRMAVNNPDKKFYNTSPRCQA